MQPEDIREVPFPITVNRLWGQDMQISDQDLTMTIDRFGERYIEPAVEIIANLIDSEGTDQALNVYNFVGVPGTTPTTLNTYANTRYVLANHAAPMQGGKRAMVVSPDMEVAVLGFGPNLFNPVTEISRQYMEGTMGVALGYKWSMDQNIRRQTVGLTASSTPLTVGANQSGASLLTNGWNTSTKVLNQGDIIAIAGVNAVNPISYRNTGQLRTFGVAQDVTSDSSGNATIPLNLDINADTNSPFQTVANLPAASQAIYVYGLTGATPLGTISGVSSPTSLAFDKQAFTLVVARLEKPGGMEWSEEVSNPRIGLSVRLVRGYDIRGNMKLTRMDVLGGWATPRPELAVRVQG
jgi:hypothetical protein